MRQVVLDTETTGLEVGRGHRLIEIGCVELCERGITGNTFHSYVNPGRPIDEGARAITGISDEFLLDKPRFADIAERFVAFIDGAEVIAHNAEFDVGFIDAEFALANAAYGRIEDHATVLDTLALAREKYPGQPNSLNALCRRLGVDNSQRELHGALLDAQLLAEVYLAMTAGQGSLAFADPRRSGSTTVRRPASVVASRPLVVRASAAERAAHDQRLRAIQHVSGGQCVWMRLGLDGAGDDAGTA